LELLHRIIVLPGTAHLNICFETPYALTLRIHCD
jgi:hypothetical protein